MRMLGGVGQAYRWFWAAAGSLIENRLPGPEQILEEAHPFGAKRL